MDLDVLERVTIDILSSGLSTTSSPVESVLGFRMDKNHNNIGSIPDSYTYEEGNVSTSEVAGTSLYTISNASLSRSYSPNKSKALFYPRVSNKHSNLVGLKLVYNGKILMVTEIVVHDPKMRLSVKYPKMVLRVYQFAVGARIGLYEHSKEAEDFVSKIPIVSYVPTTCSYPSSLLSITRARCSGVTTIINPKHDGVSCWVYVSPFTPASLLLQTKHGGGFYYEYCGRLDCLKDLVVDCPRAILVEMIGHSGKWKLIAVDMFSQVAEDYKNRYDTLVGMLSKFPFTKTRNKYLNSYLCEVTSGSEVSSKESICEIMSTSSRATDGYIVYIGDERPFKVKLSSMVTLDMEYNYRVTNGVVAHTWNVSEGHKDILGTLGSPLIEYPYLEPDKTYVFEVRVADRSIIRIRTDRTRGNSKQVIDFVMRAYSKDKKYSLSEVWSAEDLRFMVLMNRCFKYYSYVKYIPKGSRVIDMGSGNGGDSGMWRDMEYTILAVEKDSSRCSVLKKKVGDNPKITVKCRDMLDIESILRNTPIRYTYATFMRSIGHLDRKDIIHTLTLFREYKINRVVVVTMVVDATKSCGIVDTSGQHFSIKMDDDGSTIVDYFISSKAVTYSDRCYTLCQWHDMAVESGYIMSVEYQWDVMVRLYGLKHTSVTYPCSTDAVLILDDPEQL